MLKENINVLHILGGGNEFSGIASYLYQQYKYINHNKVHYDFLFVKENSMKPVMNNTIFIDSNFFELRDKIAKSESINYLKFYKDLKRILLEYRYDVIVVNSSVIELSFVTWLVVRILNKNIGFISHAHNSSLHIKNGAKRKKIGFIMNIVDNICKYIIRENSDFLFACSKEAGKRTFGDSSILQSNFKVINNAIDLNKFSFNQEVRNKIRQQMLKDEAVFVVGNVGTLIPSKNQAFLLKIFSELHKKIERSELWLIGSGPDRISLENEVKKMSLENSVKFLGLRKDVNELMQAMDCFVFPSLSEGLGIVAIESQAVNLPTFVSDGVPDDVLLTQNIQKIGLKESPEFWVNEIIKVFSFGLDQRNTLVDLGKFGFDIKKETEKLADFYINNFNSENKICFQ